MRKIISSCLLVIMAFVLTPAEVWHECASHHELEHNHGELQHDHHESEQNDSDDCDICDFEYASFLGASIIQAPNALVIFRPFIAFEIVQAAIGKFEKFRSRGPPSA